MVKKQVFIINVLEKKILLREGAFIVGSTNLVGDVYKIGNSQVTSGMRKVGEKKTRMGYILNIIDEDSVIVQFTTSQNKFNDNWKFQPKNNRKFVGREHSLRRISFKEIINQYNKQYDLDFDDLNKLKEIIDLNLNQKKHLSKYLDYPGKQKRLEDTTSLSKSKENNYDKGKNDIKKVYKNKGRVR